MKHTETETVVLARDARPLGKPDRCFCCGFPAGSKHSAVCVVPQRSIVMEYTFTVVVSVPAHWDTHLIEFQRNEGSWCADNALDELKAQTDGGNEVGGLVGGCWCDGMTAKYIREADQDDHDARGFQWKG